MAKNVVIIAGNIGAGKSTLTDYLMEREGSLCIPEFIDPAWRDHFYADRKKFTAYFEKSCLMGRIARHITAKKSSGTVFFDRGLIEGREIFVQNSFNEGYLSHKHLNSYDHDLKEAIDQELGREKKECKKWLEGLIVYMNAPPELCYKRQRKRAEDKEDKREIIPLDYFYRLDENYQTFVNNINSIYKKWGLPLSPTVLEIDASRDISKDKGYLEETAKKIINKLEGLR